jgi:hypothetical protein
MFSERSPPPTSKDFVENLNQKVVRNQGVFLRRPRGEVGPHE